MIPVWAVLDIFWNTVKGILGISISYKSFSFQNFPFYKIRNNTTTFISKFGISLGFNQLFDNLSFYV